MKASLNWNRVCFLKGSALRVSSYEFGYKRFTRDIDIMVKERIFIKHMNP